MLWAAGVHASPLAIARGCVRAREVDHAGRIATRSDLTLPGHPDVFAVGDMVALDDLPGVAEVAMQGGLHAARTVARDYAATSDRSRSATATSAVSRTIGRFSAVFSFGRVRARGFAAWLVWMVVHLTFLNGFANRFSTLSSWIRSMIGRSRAERVFSVGHVGGDLSAPPAVLAAITPNQFPADPCASP